MEQFRRPHQTASFRRLRGVCANGSDSQGALTKRGHVTVSVSPTFRKSSSDAPAGLSAQRKNDVGSTRAHRKSGALIRRRIGSLCTKKHTSAQDGSDDYNQQQLSERRGAAVRDYLTQQGIAASSVTSKGLGETQPTASNDTAEGRQRNRRVELIVSDELIGTELGPPIAAR
ncbi:MAG: OmpA family protein [Bryobacteraceae bacterium]|nr:OmpA family protein [Bryobacteraceae bacterium]